MPIRNEVPHRPYRVTRYDRAGEADWKYFAIWQDALDQYRRWRIQHKGQVIEIINQDRVDYDTDGLTEIEREAIEEI